MTKDSKTRRRRTDADIMQDLSAVVSRNKRRLEDSEKRLDEFIESLREKAASILAAIPPKQ
jgi:hypothetical protein